MKLDFFFLSSLYSLRCNAVTISLRYLHEVHDSQNENLVVEASTTNGLNTNRSGSDKSSGKMAYLTLIYVRNWLTLSTWTSFPFLKKYTYDLIDNVRSFRTRTNCKPFQRNQNESS
jgi:hypothetical protein